MYIAWYLEKGAGGRRFAAGERERERGSKREREEMCHYDRQNNKEMGARTWFLICPIACIWQLVHIFVTRGGWVAFCGLDW